MDLLERDQSFFSAEFSEADLFLIAARMRMECHTIGTEGTPAQCEGQRFIDLLNCSACQETWFVEQLSSDMGITVEQLEERNIDCESVDKLQIGDFIDIPAWPVHGCVFDINASILGSDKAVDILLQEHPDQSAKHMKTYRLEPSEYTIDN